MTAGSRAAIGRRLLVAGLALLVGGALVGAALTGRVSFGLVDRPALVAGIIFAVTLFQALRTAYRVWRYGPDAATPKPPAPGPAADRDEALDSVDAFLVAERFKLVGDRYDLTKVGADGRSAAEPVARIDRAAFQARESLEAYSEEGRLVFAVEAQQILDIGGRYVVTDGHGGRIGELRKLFVASLVRSTWEVWDGAGTLVATAQERSVGLAVARRLIEVLPLPIPYHFDVRALDGSPLGSVHRLRTLRDRYLLELPGDPGRSIDRRLALALAVVLDALQDR